jgi:peptide/nickel transport system permease protein
MLKYVLTRILLIVPTLAVVIFMIFCILSITPGDPAKIILGQNARPEAIAELHETLGLDRPLLERFGRYMLDILRFDFGTSYRTQAPVFEDILIKFPTTLRLAAFSIFFSALLGIPLGIISAVRQYSVLDYSLTVTSLALASIPSFFLALLLILLFSLLLAVLPSTGVGTPAHYVLPVATLTLPSAAYLSRMTRTSMLETMRQDYIRTAKAKGADKRRVITHHALKPALMPIVTLLGMSFAGLLGGALIIEVVFGLPGIGNLILTAVKNKDAPVVQAATIFLAVLYKLIMILVDMLQAASDPRLKAQFK